MCNVFIPDVTCQAAAILHTPSWATFGPWGICTAQHCEPAPAAVEVGMMTSMRHAPPHILVCLHVCLLMCLLVCIHVCILVCLSRWSICERDGGMSGGKGGDACNVHLLIHAHHCQLHTHGLSRATHSTGSCVHTPASAALTDAPLLPSGKHRVRCLLLQHSAATSAHAAPLPQTLALGPLCCRCRMRRRSPSWSPMLPQTLMVPHAATDPHGPPCCHSPSWAPMLPQTLMGPYAAYVRRVCNCARPSPLHDA